MQKEKIVADRNKRVRQIEQSLNMVLKQLENLGDVSESKVTSLQNRKTKYEQEIALFSKPLTDEVRRPELFVVLVVACRRFCAV
jgi:hypothetical protein